jgi:CheY-like chemotaxis protein
MPGVSGLELARRIVDRWPDLPALLTSGYSHVLAQDARHGFALLHKPHSIGEFVARASQRGLFRLSISSWKVVNVSSGRKTSIAGRPEVGRRPMA